MIRVCCMMLGCLLVLSPAWAQNTLTEALGGLEASLGPLSTTCSAPTWGQQEALADLQRLREVTQELRSALAQDPQVTPASLHAMREKLGVARLRLQASLPLLGLGGNQALLAQVDKIVACLRVLELRFDGRAQPQGAALAQGALDPSPLPGYTCPRELLGEARNVRWLAEAFTRLRGAWRGGTSPGWGWGTEFYDFVGAAYDFESACSWEYPNVALTRPAYRKLVRTYERARSFGYGLDTFRWTQLEKAFSRLAEFYAVAP